MLCGCDALWLCDVVGCPVFCDVVNWQMMCCDLRTAHDSKTFEMSTPMRGEALPCKTQQDYGEPRSQYYDSVVQSTTPYYHELQSTKRYYEVLPPTTLRNFTNYDICQQVTRKVLRKNTHIHKAAPHSSKSPLLSVIGVPVCATLASWQVSSMFQSKSEWSLQMDQIPAVPTGLAVGTNPPSLPTGG